MRANELQKQAIKHKDGACMVLAGPGSGKTTVITERIKYLVEEYQVQAEKILVITFTKAAAVEMKQRFSAMSGGIGGVSFGTFHALFFKIIKYAYHYDASSILREDERIRYLKDTAEALKIDGREAEDFIFTLSGEISKVKGNELDPEQFDSAICDGDAFLNIYREFSQLLSNEKKLDFDDMMLLCLKLFKERPDILSYWQGCYEYILIDEFQDINPLQYKLVRLLAQPQNNIFIVGDDDQSIYSFRGSKPELMFSFEKDYRQAQKIILGQNYRCGEHIVKASASLISHNKKRFKKALVSEGAKRDSVIFRAFDSLENENKYVLEMIRVFAGENISLDNIAVLYRTNSEPRALIRLLKEANIPFVTKEKIPNIFDHWITKNLLAYMEMAAGNLSRTIMMSVMNRPKRYITRDSVRSENITFECLYAANKDKSYVKEKLDKLKYDLGIITKLDPYAAIKYIRFAVGYEDFLKEYSRERGIDFEELREILDEVAELVRECRNFSQLKEFIEDYGELLRSGGQGEKDKAANALNNAKETGNGAETEENEGVHLMTYHSSKGLEFDAVFLIDASEDFAPYWQAETTADIEEERRMFYVAMTRAKKRLYITHARERFGREYEVSRFVKEAGLLGK